jgi:predicted XRE-type DNA-binding protein
MDLHTGSSFDSFLQEQGWLQEAEAVAIKRVIAWQLDKAMKEKKLSKKAMAERLHTSRSQVDRLLDPQNTAVSLSTITKAAGVVGKTIRVQMVGLAAPARHRKKTSSRRTALHSVGASASRKRA